MRNRVEEYFPVVLEIVEQEFEQEIKNGGIPNEYKGYISNFGAMIIDSGLLSALAFFGKNDGSEKEDRSKIIKIIKKFLIKENEIDRNKSNSEKLVKLIIEKVKVDNEELRRLENMIIDIAIATKLSLRTFLVKKD